MKSIAIFVFFIINCCAIRCMPIETSNEIFEASETEDLTSTPLKTSDQHTFVNIKKTQVNSSRMTIPDDVEWIKPTTKSQPQSALPTVGSIFELIFAVSFPESKNHKKIFIKSFNFKQVLSN